MRANEGGTFAHTSVAVRLPEIAGRTIDENDLSRQQHDEVALLIDDIESGSIAPVHEAAAQDASEWASYVDQHAGMSWLDAPWFFVETYFYRRLLAATGYSRPGTRYRVDPFAVQKRAGLDGSLRLADGLGGMLDDVAALVGAAVWANQVDLSLWPAGEPAGAAESRTREVIGGDRTGRLVVDDTDGLITRLGMPAGPTLTIVLDNAGAELVADLALAAALAQRGVTIVLHAKAHPTFVSDATTSDVLSTIRRLAAETSPARTIGALLTKAVSDSTVRVIAPPFWVSPSAMWEAPASVADQLRVTDLVIVKGDANYRRLLGDRHWDPREDIAAIIRPPVPLFALRTLKSEVVAGVAHDVIDRAGASDPDWMVNGEWGLVQYAPATNK